MSPSRWVFVSAGEVSGDRIAAPVIRHLRRRRPELRFFGAGGPELARAGVEVRHSVEQLAVTGISEVAGALRGGVGLLIDTAVQMVYRRPALGILVDYPGVNLRLAWLLRRCGIPVLYYVAPQRWAWLPARARLLGRRVNRLAVTLPFEQTWFADKGVSSVYVGHPLVDTVQWRPNPSPGSIELPQGPVLAIFPGSRPNEVERHLPLLADTSRRLSGIRVVVAAIDGAHAQRCREIAPELEQIGAERAWAIADAALCASGTATLEAALAGVPIAVFYRLSPLSYAVLRHLVCVPHIALPNLILGESLVPELVQHAVTVDVLAQWARRLLEPDEANRQRLGYERVRQLLGKAGVSKRVADLALDLMRGPPAPAATRDV